MTPRGGNAIFVVLVLPFGRVRLGVIGLGSRNGVCPLKPASKIDIAAAFGAEGMETRSFPLRQDTFANGATARFRHRAHRKNNLETLGRGFHIEDFAPLFGRSLIADLRDAAPVEV